MANSTNTATSATFDVSPVTSSSGFTLPATLHVVAGPSTVWLDNVGSGLTTTLWFDTYGDGTAITITGSYNAATQTFTAKSVQAN